TLIFDRIRRVHGLGKRDRLLLRLAAILHDIGMYISLRSHYFHTYRLIISGDIIGLSNLEKEIVANLACYVSKQPRPEDEPFASLDKKEQVRVGKLAAILRIADSIDRSHRHKVEMCDVQLKGEEMYLHCQAREDMTLEEWTFEDKADFFIEVFGVRPILVKEIV
ncbi:MAG: HD domain-containing protein, partial [Negativicutes bacterium]|nr:HD domain-containing protein [Negativicutes bacterium]